MPNKEKINRIIDFTGISLIGLFSLGYLLFAKRFSELHISVFFLDFPVFIGEILLFLCLILFFVKIRLAQKKTINTWCYLFLFYFGLVLIKAFAGYFRFGALAFRHAALFYYPLFAVFGCVFYKRDFFSNKKNIFLVLVLILIMGFIPFYDYFLLVCFILAFLLIKAYPRKSIRYLLFSFLLITNPYSLFFKTSRTMLVSNVVAGVFIGLALFFILKIRKIYKIILSISFLLFILIGMLKLADNSAIRSLLDFKNLTKLYDQFNKVIIEKQDSFKMIEIKEVKLYNPESEPEVETNQPKVKTVQDSLGEAQRQIQKIQQKIQIIQSKTKELQQEMKEIQFNTQEAQPMMQAMQFKINDLQKALKGAQSKMQEAESRIEEIQLVKLSEIQEEAAQFQIEQRTFSENVDGKQINSLYRIFIWRDMLVELGSEKPIFGFHFGKPLRSKSLEIHSWGDTDWKRDGWITPHNSYLHIIYRFGIIGIAFILGIFIVLFKMIKKAIDAKSFTGVLLCAGLINWLVVANFLVILELPYNAIPFWSLFGMTFAYISNLNLKGKGV